MIPGVYLHMPVFHLSATSLEIGSPEIGPLDLTELETVIKPFPATAAERSCYCYLLEQMEATPECAPKTKIEIKKFCRGRFRMTVESFECCWRKAIKASGARWDKPGRRRRAKSSP